MNKTSLIKLILTVVIVCGVLLGYTAVTHATVFTYTSNTEKYLGSGYLELINETGVTWTDFHFGLTGYVGAWGFVGDSYSGPGIAEYGGGYYGLYQPLDITGLNIPDGSTYSLSFEVGHVGEVLSGYFVTGTPSIGGASAVPEPTSLLLIGAGLLGVGFLRRRLSM